MRLPMLFNSPDNPQNCPFPTGQCDKLVTDDGHQFATLTVNLS